eukprot:TRINITY_DN375_c0_g1_i1.p1 TRINITY_DN375_c0_g1~~TRINITY_DN375_c0_g1_i1.p1  ORF type:complete len:464 (+),score=121.01 TRINITY_DN375_c0_g1_i1:91-1482(+)
MSSHKGKQRIVEEEEYPNNGDEDNYAEVIEQKSNQQILSQQVKWNDYRKAEVISGESLELLKAYDGKSPEAQADLIEEAPERYAELFLQLLSFTQGGVANTDVIQHVLAWIDEILKDEDKASIFLRCKEPFNPFLDVLRPSSDWFINSRASRILAQLLAADSEVHAPHAHSLQLWCITYLRDHKDSVGDLISAIHALTLLFRKAEYRQSFGQSEGLRVLHNLLKSNMRSQQMIYKVLFCMWVLSFETEVAEAFADEQGLIEDLVEILRLFQKEKIRRMAIALLKNLLVVNKAGGRSGGRENRGKMVEAGISRVLGYLNNKKWGDVDIEEDLAILTEELGKDLVKMTSWEVYYKEIKSGNLGWTPVHKTEKFWRENVHRFEDNNREVLGILLGLIRSSKSSLVKSVALYDIGEFCRFHPKGRKIIGELEGKNEIMLMIGTDPEVSKQALLCMQKMMVTNWEMLS